VSRSEGEESKSEGEESGSERGGIGKAEDCWRKEAGNVSWRKGQEVRWKDGR